MITLKHVLGPAIPMSEARVLRVFYTRAFHAFEASFAFLAALSHPFAPLHDASLPTQFLFWAGGQLAFVTIYSVTNITLLRLSLRLGKRTVHELAIMAITMLILVPISITYFRFAGIAVDDAKGLAFFFVFCFLLFEIASFAYLAYGDRALFPEIYAPPEAPPEPERTYEVFLRGTPLPVASVEIIRALDKGIEVTGLNQTFTARRSLQLTLSELPVNLGIQIHRTIWVSRHLARNHVNEGGTLYVTTSDGKRFPVARSRRAEFLAWIRMTQG